MKCHQGFIVGITALLLGAAVGCGSRGPRDYVPTAERFTLRGERVPQNDQTLTVATFNLRGMSMPQLLAEDLRQLPAIDVWLFQEVPVPPLGEPLQPTIDKLRALLPVGDWQGVVARMNPDDVDGNGWEGQATLSRLPISGDAQLWPLETSGPKRRRALSVIVETSVGLVQIVNTDHEVSFLDPTYGNQKQTSSLVARLRRNAEQPAIVGGDFNSAGNAFRWRTSTKDVSQIVDELDGAGFSPLPDRANAQAAPTYKLLFAGVQIDHLFSRKLDCLEWESPVASGSDHRPVWARYRLMQP